jgi:hypothetical protein
MEGYFGGRLEVLLEMLFWTTSLFMNFALKKVSGTTNGVLKDLEAPSRKIEGEISLN